jgi:hypothetical protein
MARAERCPEHCVRSTFFRVYPAAEVATVFRQTVGPEKLEGDLFKVSQTLFYPPQDLWISNHKIENQVLK